MYEQLGHSQGKQTATQIIFSPDLECKQPRSAEKINKIRKVTANCHQPA